MLILIDAVWSGNFGRGEIVSPVGSIASKVVGNLNLVTPDARHRRPLKFLLYHQSVKTQRTAPSSILPHLDSCCIAVLAGGAFICHFVLRKWQNEVPLAKCRAEHCLVLLVRDCVFLQ